MKRFSLLAATTLLLAGCVPYSELKKANEDLAAARQRIKSLEDELARTKSELEQSEADTAKLQPSALDPRQLPVRVRLRRTGPRGVYRLVIKNESAATLGLHVIISAVGKWQDLTPFIQSGQFWAADGLASGDSIRITSDHYDPQSFTVR